MSEVPLTTGQAGKIASKNPRTIVNWIHKGWLKAMKLPGERGHYLIMEADLRQTMAARYTPKPYEPEAVDGQG